MSRRLYLDRSIGEMRGVVALDGYPERLIIERDADVACQRLGARSIARVRNLNRTQGSAFLELPDGPDGVAPAGRLIEGQAVAVAVAAEARADKGPHLTIGEVADGPPRLISAGPTLAERLAGFCPGAAVLEGPAARQAADQAQAAALDISHPLAGGGVLTLEATRALTAIDVDLGPKLGGDARRAARQVNLAAIAQGARLLRLKGLGGLVVFDLVGKGHDGAALSEAARRAFAPEGSAVSIGPISRFGLFELSLPWTVRPLAEKLLQSPGRLSALSLALQALRSTEREAAAQPGTRLVLSLSADVATACEPYMSALTDRFGGRIRLVVAPVDRESIEVSAE